jgi:hypothetical protein
MFASLWNAAALHSGIEIVARDSAGQCLAATRLASAATDHRGAAAPYQRGARNGCRVGEARQGGRVPFMIRARVAKTSARQSAAFTSSIGGNAAAERMPLRVGVETLLLIAQPPPVPAAP